jgi:hypothetical protein
MTVHVRLPREGKKTGSIMYISSAILNPIFDVNIRVETPCFGCKLPYSNDTSMSISVIPIPEPFLNVTKGIDNQFDGSGSIGDENEIEVHWISLEEAQ